MAETEIIKPVMLDETGQRMAGAMEYIAAERARRRVAPLVGTDLAAEVLEVVGVPEYVDDVTKYAAFGLTDTGWYAFARITAQSGVTVTAAATVTGAAGYIAMPGTDYIDVAVRFEVAAMAQRVVIDWGAYAEAFVFAAPDLAVRNLDYRTTFYVYDIAPYAHWEYALTTDAAFVADRAYFIASGDDYAPAEVVTGDPVPAYYVSDGETYVRATEGVFAEGVDYYTLSDGEYTLAEVTVGDPIPAYYVHSRVTFSGMARNITYKCDTVIDCPQVYVLPEIEDDVHGCWFEIRLRHAGSYSSTLQVPDGVKVATEHTQAETAGLNMVDLHYSDVGGVKIWRFLNTHSSIPA